MSLDMSKLVSTLGDEAIAKCGEPVGLEKDQSIRVARSLAKHFNKGREEAVKQAAEETGLAQEVVAAMLGKLVETGGEKLLEDSPLGGVISSAGGDAAKNAATGMFGKLFGRKAG